MKPSENTCGKGVAVVTPLRKRYTDGTVYTRPTKIETKIVELRAFSHEEVIERCKIQQRDDPDYVPSECLVHFVRACRDAPSDAYFEHLYKILAERVLRRLPRTDGKTEELKQIQIRENVFDRFKYMIAEDRTTYSNQLDYYEIRFDQALKRRICDAKKQVWRDENRKARLEIDQFTGELSTEVEQAAGSFEPFDQSRLDNLDYRSRLDAAIDSLPELQRRIIEMILKEFPIDSNDPDAVTISKTLGKSEKTIRTHRNKAHAALHVALKTEEEA